MPYFKFITYIILILSYSLSLKAYGNNANHYAMEISDAQVDIAYLNRLILNLDEERDLYINEVNKNFNHLNYIVFAYINLKKTPKELLLYQNHSLETVIKSRAMLDYYSRTTRRELEQYYTKIEDIKNIKNKINRYKGDIEYLSNKSKKLLVKLRKAEESFSPEFQDISSITKELNKLSNKTKSLISIAYAIDVSASSKEDKENNLIFNNAKGQLKPPVAGELLHKFQEGKSTSLDYYYITFLPMPNAIVVSPYKGIVIFADKIPGYNNTIIIKHFSSYYSIISNIHSIEVLPGQVVSEGSKLGFVSDKPPSLLYGLKYKNKNINPLNWLDKETLQ